MSPAPGDRNLQRRLATLASAGAGSVLQGGLKGVEKESLRVTPDGFIAMTPHPRALGSALTNRYITTDYSEALLELVTPTFNTTWELIAFLTDLHRFSYSALGDELLWAASMPCRIRSDDDVPIAVYGSSHAGQMKHVYRRGLGWRYGRRMQAISGVHFNYSFPRAFWEVLAGAEGAAADQDFISAGYFALLRNYRRFGWLVLYLFGVSPVVCGSFLTGMSDHGLEPFTRGTFIARHATSLRMSDLGYRNPAQSGVTVSVNSLDEYVRDLSRVVATPYPPYEKIGVKVDGEYRQLTTNILQIENEYYSYIRPKRVTKSGESPTTALRSRGVEYVEVRALDVSPFDPVGVNQNKLRFIEALLALCVLKDSPPLDASAQRDVDANQLQVARHGRDPKLRLRRGDQALSPAAWAGELLDEMQGLCEMLDAGDDSRPYAAALAVQRNKLADPGLLPSARLVAELARSDESFFELALRTSIAHRDYFRDIYPVNPARLAEFAAESRASLARQARMEADDRGSFEDFLQHYYRAELDSRHKI
ncbi:MAG: glutamate--cysteine ligase [Steroidobacteraceae bacterium]